MLKAPKISLIKWNMLPKIKKRNHSAKVCLSILNDTALLERLKSRNDVILKMCSQITAAYSSKNKFKNFAAILANEKDLKKSFNHLRICAETEGQANHNFKEKLYSQHEIFAFLKIGINLSKEKVIELSKNMMLLEKAEQIKQIQSKIIKPRRHKVPKPSKEISLPSTTLIKPKIKTIQA